MLEIGDEAPDFTLPDERGEAVSLSDLLSAGPAVLYFYPADFTPVCTAEACTFRDMHPQLAAAGLRLAGVSPQGQNSHVRFKRKHELPFALLSDPDKRVITRYGANGPLGLGTRRVTYLISPGGRIEARVRADLSAARHRAFVEHAMASVRQNRPESRTA